MKNSTVQKIILGTVSGIFFLYALSLIFPFVWTLYNSFKDNRAFFAEGGVWNLPKRWMFENYINVWKEYDLVIYFWNSIKITAIGTFLSVLNSSTAAYVVAKYRFWGKGLIYTTVITVMLIPGIGSLAALYRFMNRTGLYNTHLGLLLLYAGGLGMGFLILYGFFQGISWSYAEAAFVDGASDWQVFVKVMLPQAKPAIGAVAIIQGIGIWNDYFSPYMFLQDTAKFTLSVGLRQIVLEQSYAADWPKMFAAMIIATVPIVILYAATQNTLIENTVAGGLKG
jgi:ABC-type glycerol-3-phosphate transport system permease component